MSTNWIALLFSILLLNFSGAYSDLSKNHAHVYKNGLEIGKAASITFRKQLKRAEKENKQLVVVFPACITSLEFYEELISSWKNQQLDLSNVITFSLNEYVGLDKNHPKSTYFFLHTNFYNLVSNKLTHEKLSSYGLRLLEIEDLSDNLLKRFSLDKINTAIRTFKNLLLDEYNNAQNLSYQECEKIYWRVLKGLKNKDEIYDQLNLHVFNYKVLPASKIFLAGIHKDMQIRKFGLKAKNIHFPEVISNKYFDPEKSAKTYKQAYEKYSKNPYCNCVFYLNLGKDSAHIGYNSFNSEKSYLDPNLSEEEKNNLALNSSIRTIPIGEKTKLCNSVFFDNDVSKTPDMAIVFGLSEMIEAHDVVILARGISKQNSLYDTLSCKKPTYQIPASLLNYSKHCYPCFYIDERAYGSGANTQINLRSFYQELTKNDPTFINIYYHNADTKTIFDIPSMKKPAIAINPFSETNEGSANLITLPKDKKILFITKPPKSNFHFIELLKLKRNDIRFLAYKNTQSVSKAIEKFKPDIVFFPSDLRKSKRFIPTLKTLLSKNNYQKPLIGMYYSNQRKTNDSVLPLSEEVVSKKVEALEKYHLSQNHSKDFRSRIEHLATYYRFKYKGEVCANENYEIYHMIKNNDSLSCKRLSKQLITIEEKPELPKGYSNLKLKKEDKIIAVAPHPDDAEISMGGLFQLCFKGDISPVILNATTGHRVKINKIDLKSLSTMVPQKFENFSSYDTFGEVKDEKYKTMIREFETMNALKFLNPLSIVESLRLPFYVKGMITQNDKDSSFDALERHISAHKGRIFVFLPRQDDSHPTHQLTTELFYSSVKEILESYPEKDIYVAFYRTAWTGYWNLYHYNSHFGSKLAANVGAEIIPGVGNKHLSTTDLGGEFAERFFVFDIIKPFQK